MRPRLVFTHQQVRFVLSGHQVYYPVTWGASLFITTVGHMPVLAFKVEGRSQKSRCEILRKPMQGSMARNFSSFGIALEKRAGGTIPQSLGPPFFNVFTDPGTVLFQDPNETKKSSTRYETKLTWQTLKIRLYCPKPGPGYSLLSSRNCQICLREWPHIRRISERKEIVLPKDSHCSGKVFKQSPFPRRGRWINYLERAIANTCLVWLAMAEIHGDLSWISHPLKNGRPYVLSLA